MDMQIGAAIIVPPEHPVGQAAASTPTATQLSMNRRRFLHALSLAGLAPLATGPVTLPSGGPAPRAPSRLLIDADTANEIDDLYAIVRALRAPDVDLVGLSSAQWNHRLSPDDTVQQSQQLNEDLLRLMGRLDIPHPLGAEMIVGKPWGGTEPRNSPAAQLMIQAARQTPDGETLTIASLGAATNLASAIQLAPDIVPKIACYVLGGRFFADREVWDKNEFNVRNDLNAANILFDTEGLELHVMPINILFDFTFRRDAVMERLAGQGGVWDYLAARWLSHSPDSDTWIMWDVALIEALLRPELATEGRFQTPPENVQRTIHVYTSVDEAAMRSDWWATARAAYETPSATEEGNR
jgi:inosine-uridine nucleoside N-ribohydrolase